jgi:CPA2 family monovalent cation:H+ antiporter-2
MAILLMVILSALSVPGSFSGTNLAFLSGRLVFFLLIWFLIGIYVLPSILTRVRKLLSNEIMLIVSIGLCFLMVVLATKAEFSAALGAFIMGSILAETAEGERIEHLLSSVKDLFAAVFFVSVGMMINPSILQQYFWVIILITVVTILGKLLGSGFGAVLSGRSLKHSTQAGMSLAQIGEFSFIIASLGVSLKVVSDFLYPIVIAVSAVTTFTTPYMIRYSGPIYSWIEARLPEKFLNLLGQYETAMASNGKESALGLIWKTYGMLILLNAVVVIAIGFSVSHFALPVMISTFGDERNIRALTCFATLAACSPFLYGTVLKVPKVHTKDANTLLRLSRLQPGTVIFRGIIGLVLVDVVISQFATTRALPLIVLASTPVLVFLFRKKVGQFYGKIENRFLQNLNAKELAEIESLVKRPQLAPWDASLTQLVLSSDSKIAGLTLEESKFRTTTGATVAMIDRGRRRIFAPGRAERLLPGDELFLIGTEEQLAEVQKLVQAETTAEPPAHDELYNLESFYIEERSRYANMSIRDIGVGAEFGGIVVGVENGGTRVLNPESTVVLRPGDLVWVFGHKNKIRDIAKAGRSV